MLYASVLFLIAVHFCTGAPDLRRAPHDRPDLRIIDGGDAPPQAAPYFAHVVVTIDGKLYYCGGTLIRNQYVLTAAQCLADAGAKVSSVTLGLHRVGQSEPVQRVGGAVFRFHQDYDKNNTARHDVAIIRLDTPANITKGSVETAQLPNPADFPAGRNAYDGELVTLYGWGDTQEKPPVVPDALQTLEAQVVPYVICSTESDAHEDELCVGRRDGAPGVACAGDAGGPLVRAGVLVGVQSQRSTTMCSASYVALYARVDYNMGWIERTVRELEEA